MIELNVKDVLFFETHRNREMIVLHTQNEQFYAPGTLKYWTEALRASGERFEIIDRNNAAHLTKVKHVDRRFRIAYFSEGKDAKKCTISINNVAKVLAFLETKKGLA
ncbi:LytTR family transcriptional regulator DNA-binding domain-containing protein [Cohnella nanjingensis]|uniref:LytTR family transcriptional regulator DNA-binding domain-containing protein n=1 Tax=Cohnella nanjingensis TaxID=1387779 RepID=A0A7X0RLK7_9BACL|nr:LytTR family transcriptional regulator DNA-binding domain-containing protein [Cohnella nanjingensis]MBB6669738.1 LytTR family transcriptional regulator DNA-binding domain-containing protein [Cohnella nanjingensis]